MAKPVDVKKLKKQEAELKKSIKKMTTEEKKGSKNLVKLKKEIEKAEKKKEGLRIVEGSKFTKANSLWGVEITGKTITPISGSKAFDIKPLVGSMDKSIRDIESKLIQKEAEMILKKTTPLPEEIDGIREEITETKKRTLGFACPLNVFHRDRQTLDKDDKPVPVIGGHMAYAPFRDTIKSGYYDIFQVYSQLTPHKGWPSDKHLKNYVSVTPHIFMYLDDKFKNRLEEKHLKIEGQNPVGDVKGFSQYEITPNNVFFKFTMMFNPRGKFPSLANKELVLECIQFAVDRGLGSRRGANYGIWEIIDIKPARVARKNLYSMFNKKGK